MFISFFVGSKYKYGVLIYAAVARLCRVTCIPWLPAKIIPHERITQG